MISASAQHYLKVIYSLSEWSNDSITISSLSKILNVANSTVSEMIKKLVDFGYVNHVPYKGITLTYIGEKEALKVVRAHRLLETFLYEILKYSVNEVHEEAQLLQNVVSDKFLKKIDILLSYPTVDPHGDPIPDENGIFLQSAGKLLSALNIGEKGIVVRISDANSDLLSFLENLGVTIGACIKIVEKYDCANLTRIDVNGNIFDITSSSLDSIRVE